MGMMTVEQLGDEEFQLRNIAKEARRSLFNAAMTAGVLAMGVSGVLVAANGEGSGIAVAAAGFGSSAVIARMFINETREIAHSDNLAGHYAQEAASMEQSS